MRLPTLGLLLLAPVCLMATPFVLRWWTAVRYGPRVMAPRDVPRAKVAIVFGAGLRPDGTPTGVLRDRLETAADLHFAAKIEKLLLSGDNHMLGYNEPESMRQYALGLGVPAGALVLDYAGRSTYDSCYRARAVFGLRQAVLVTQAFHLDRALYLCDAFGIKAVGVAARRRTHSPGLERWWKLREVAATAIAWWDVNVARPVPVLGEPMPIS